MARSAPRSSTSIWSSRTPPRSPSASFIAPPVSPMANWARRARWSSIAAAACRARKRCAPPRSASRASSTRRRLPLRRSIKRWPDHPHQRAVQPYLRLVGERRSPLDRVAMSELLTDASRDRFMSEAVRAAVTQNKSEIEPVDAQLTREGDHAVRLYHLGLGRGRGLPRTVSTSTHSI